MRLFAFNCLLLAFLISSQPALAAGRLTISSIDHRVAMVYGEKRPHLVHVQKTRTEATYERMFLVSLSGHFRKGHRRARYLRFSALADRWYVWGIQAYDRHHRLVWADAALPHALTH